MSRVHVVCRDCLFEGLAPSWSAADRAARAHTEKEEGHTVATGSVTP